jgi:polyhydroxyalkanoate synthase subunit PhaC
VSTHQDVKKQKLPDPPRELARGQMNLFWDYYSLWQHSTMRFRGLSPEPVAAPRFQDELWEEHFLGISRLCKGLKMK